jgi:hypothetical protein
MKEEERTMKSRKKRVKMNPVIRALALFAALSATIALSCATGALAAHGTGVGNGGNSARDVYLANLKRELAVRQSNGNPSAAITAWCSQVSSVLLRERQRAMLQYQYEKLDSAEQILIDALVVSAQSLADSPNPKPMTKKLIDRTLIYSEALDQALPDDKRLSQVTKLNFLFSSVDFIVDVARTLDPPYYIPYQYQYGGCTLGCPSAFPFSEFEARFVRMASRELSFVVHDLTEAAPQSGSARIFPVGNPHAFLTVAALVTSDVAQDLSENLHAYENACAISDLQIRSAELTAYNLNGDRSIFPNDPWAVSQTAEQMTRLSDRIAANAPFCLGYGYPIYGGPGDSNGPGY